MIGIRYIAMALDTYPGFFYYLHKIGGGGFQAAEDRLVAAIITTWAGHNSMPLGVSPDRAASMLSRTDFGISLPNLL